MAEEAGDEITPLGEWLGARSPAGKSLPGRLVEYLLAAEENIDVDESRLLEEKLQGIKYNKMLKWWLATLEDRVESKKSLQCNVRRSHPCHGAARTRNGAGHRFFDDRNRMTTFENVQRSFGASRYAHSR